MEIDEALAEAHTSLAFIKFRGEWNWAEAEKEFQRAIELNPGTAASHHWYALYLTAMGQQAEAIKQIKCAQELDPLSLIITSAAGRVLHFASHYEEALQEFQKALEMDPNYAEAHFNLGFTYAAKGLYSEAIGELRKALDLSTNRTLILAVLGHTYSMAGKQAEARKVLEQLHKLSKCPLEMAIVYTGLGEFPQALEWFEKAFEERSGPLVYLKVEALYNPLRHEARFQNLLRRMNLSSSADEAGSQ